MVSATSKISLSSDLGLIEIISLGHSLIKTSQPTIISALITPPIFGRYLGSKSSGFNLNLTGDLAYSSSIVFNDNLKFL